MCDVNSVKGPGLMNFVQFFDIFLTLLKLLGMVKILGRMCCYCRVKAVNCQRLKVN